MSDLPGGSAESGRATVLPPAVEVSARDEVVVRPMRRDDVPGAQAVADVAMREAGTRYGWVTPEVDDEGRARAQARHAHLLATDPDGCWVAEAGGRVVGIGLALVRERLWFLSLLAVDREVQAQGVGARLLEGTLRTAEGLPAGLIMASSDPKALRRYARAGFALLPGYEATGTVDRSLLPATPGVRDGDWDTDAERCDDLGRRLRGAGYGPDLPYLRDQGFRLLVADDGFAVLRDGGLKLLAAGDPATAQALLWAALAESTGEVEVAPLTADQQWGIDVVLQARLSLRPGTSMCTRGAVGPLSPYVPSGAYG